MGVSLSMQVIFSIYITTIREKDVHLNDYEIHWCGNLAVDTEELSA